MSDTAKKLDLIREGIAMELKALREQIAEFARKLPENPSYHLRWADGEFVAAAKIEVFNEIIQTIDGLAKSERDDEEQMEYLTSMLVRSTIRGAESPRHSTSIPSNLMEQYRTAAWASAAERLEWDWR